MQANEPSGRYSPHGEGYIKVYRKLLTSAVFQNEKLLKVWIWCLIRANWHEATCLFEGKEIPLDAGQFISGRYSGSQECSMNPSTFYKCIKKLEEMQNISIKSDNKKSIITVVNYDGYQSDMLVEWQQSNNKVTTKGQQSNTDKEVKNRRSKEVYTHFQKPSLDDLKAYFLELSIPDEAGSFFDYYEANGWKVGRNSMKDWKSACRNWKRNSNKFSRGTNGISQQRNNPNSAISRATYSHKPEDEKRLRELKESLDLADRERNQRTGTR